MTSRTTAISYRLRAISYQLSAIRRYAPRRAHILGVAITAGSMVLTGCKGETSKAESSSDRPASVSILGPNDVATADHRDLIEGLPVSGTLQPAVDVRIASPIPEVIEEVLVKEGQVVSKGQVLARFRATALGPQATSAETQRRIAQSDYERMKNLFSEGAVSQKDVENAELTLRSAEANEALAHKRLDEATVKAPFPGVISVRRVDSGDRVKDGDQLFQLVNTSELEFEATIASQYASRVRPGASVALAVTGVSSENGGIAGRVSRVNASVDEATRQIKIYVSVANGTRRLVGGLFASGRVVLREVRGAIAIPQPGVRTDEAGKTYVLLVENDRIARREITTGATDELQGLVQVTSGLSGTETVIVGAIEGLHEGDQVQLMKREA